MAPPGFTHHPVYSPDGRLLAAVGVLEAQPLDDVSPIILIGPADGSKAPWAAAPDLDRPIGNWTDTDLNGWMVSGQPGPFWREPDTIVAIVTDRGRSHPVRFPVDPATGAAREAPTASPRAGPGPWSDATSHALGVAKDGTIAVLGTLGMVHWLIGTSDRFRAAVSENGVTNQISDWANSDSGPEYDRASMLGDPFSKEGIDRLWRQSPLRNVTTIHTPLLMLQGEADLRCPPQDNEQLFVALRHLGRTVEYVLYPEESHVFSSSGRPDRWIVRMTRMLDWFDHYLQDA